MLHYKICGLKKGLSDGIIVQLESAVHALEVGIRGENGLIFFLLLF